MGRKEVKGEREKEVVKVGVREGGKEGKMTPLYNIIILTLVMSPCICMTPLSGAINCRSTATIFTSAFSSGLQQGLYNQLATGMKLTRSRIVMAAE